METPQNQSQNNPPSVIILSVHSKDTTLREIFDQVPLRLSRILAPAPIRELLPTTLPSAELRADFLARLEDQMKVLTLTELRPNLRVKLSEEVRHMPIVVRPEDIKLPESELRKDLLYSIGLEEGLHRGKQIGLEEGKQIGLEEGLLMDAQEMVLTVIESRLGYVPEGVEEMIRRTRDREYLRNLIKKLILSQDAERVLREELK